MLTDELESTQPKNAGQDLQDSDVEETVRVGSPFVEVSGAMSKVTTKMNPKNSKATFVRKPTNEPVKMHELRYIPMLLRHSSCLPHHQWCYLTPQQQRKALYPRCYAAILSVL